MVHLLDDALRILFFSENKIGTYLVTDRHHLTRGSSVYAELGIRTQLLNSLPRHGAQRACAGIISRVCITTVQHPSNRSVDMRRRIQATDRLTLRCWTGVGAHLTATQYNNAPVLIQVSLGRPSLSPFTTNGRKVANLT